MCGEIANPITVTLVEYLSIPFFNSIELHRLFENPHQDKSFWKVSLLLLTMIIVYLVDCPIIGRGYWQANITKQSDFFSLKAT